MAAPWEQKWKKVPGSEIRSGQAISCLATWNDGRPGTVFVKELKRSGRRPRVTEARKRFRREVASYETLSHEGLPSLIEDNSDDWGNPDVPLYLVLDYIEGGNLGKRISDHGPLTVEEAVACISRISDTVEHCHSEGVIHRDIKPANVMLRDGNSATPVVVDFGLSFTDGIDELGDLTRADEEVGNRFIQMPESWSVQTPASDVTQLAGLLLYTLTGIEPHAWRDEDDNMPHQRADAAERLRNLGLGEAQLLRLSAVFDKAFRTSPADRFQSAVEFRNALERVLEPEPDPSEFDDLMAMVDERLSQNDEAAALARSQKLQPFLSRTKGVAEAFASRKRLDTAISGHAYKHDSVDISLKRKTDAVILPPAQFRLELLGSSDVVLRVDGIEVWRGQEWSNESFDRAIETALGQWLLRSF